MHVASTTRPPEGRVLGFAERRHFDDGLTVAHPTVMRIFSLALAFLPLTLLACSESEPAAAPPGHATTRDEIQALQEDFTREGGFPPIGVLLGTTPDGRACTASLDIFLIATSGRFDLEVAINDENMINGKPLPPRASEEFVNIVLNSLGGTTSNIVRLNGKVEIQSTDAENNVSKLVYAKDAGGLYFADLTETTRGVTKQKRCEKLAKDPDASPVDR